MMRRIILTASLSLMLATGAGRAQTGGITTFPYTQQFGFVTAATTMFPSGNADGAELSADAGTPALWTTGAAGHGLNNNGGAGGAIRLQSTAGAGAAGFIWRGSMACHTADSLTISWTKVTNGAASTRLNDLRVATNDGGGTVFTDVPLARIDGGAWPAFDNAPGVQSGRLRLALPSSLDRSRDVRIRIYSVNRSGSGNHPRVVVDSLTITATGNGLDRTTIIDPVAATRNMLDTLQLHWPPLAGAGSYLVIGRQDSTPIDRPVEGRRYRAGESIGSATALVVTTDTTATISSLARNSVWFLRVIPLRDCDTSYGASSTTLAVATPAPGSSRRFALRAGRLDTVRHDGVTIRFTTAPAADGSILISRRNNPGSDGLPMHRNGKPPIDRLAGSWWEISPRGLGRFLADLSFDIAGIPGISHVDDLEVVYRLRENLIWGDIARSAVESDSSGTRLVTQGASSFGNFAIGAAGASNVLPVTLVSFEGTAARDRSLLSWRTASELESARFILSRADATAMGSPSFRTIAAIDAKGKSNGMTRYDYIDKSGVRDGIDHIYRLEEESISGEITELARIRLKSEPERPLRRNRAMLRPNPVTGNRVIIEIPDADALHVRIDIHTVGGVLLRSLTDRTMAPGERELEFDIAGLAAGFYLCRIEIGENLYALPLTILR
jgi:hypothetical protein